MRDFIETHPKYDHDSTVRDEFAHALMNTKQKQSCNKDIMQLELLQHDKMYSFIEDSVASTCLEQPRCSSYQS